MLSVLVVSPHPAVPGGVSVLIEGMKRNVAASRIDSFYVGSTGRGKEPGWQTFKRLLLTPADLALHVMRNRYDVVHINPSFNFKALVRDCLLMLGLRLTGYKRILFYFHGWDSRLQRRIVENRLLARLVAFVLNRAALITVLGDAYYDDLVMIGVDPKRIKVTRTMFEAAALKTDEAAPAPDARRFILFMSRFDKEKGARELLQAFAALSPAYPDLDLVLAGEGEDASFLRAETEKAGLQKRVRFTGYVEGAEKARLLRDCILFALPSYYRAEGMPVAVLEAMGAGKPVLAGPAGMLRRLVKDPENGVMLAKVTVEAVAQGLKRLLDDPAFAEAASKNNAEIAAQKYEARIVTAEIEAFYQQVAKC